MNFYRFCKSFIYFVCIFMHFTLFAQTYEFAVIGDAGSLDSNTRNVHNSLDRHNIKELVLPGDNIYADPFFYPKYESIWNTWVEEGYQFKVVAIGNHNRSYKEEIAYFKMPGETYSYSYDGIVEFIVLNSDNEKSIQTQTMFLENRLLNTASPFVFLVYHHPSYSLSWFHNANEKEKFQKALRPLLKKYRKKITALLVGHDHVSIIAHFNDLPVILSGSTHEQRIQFPLNYDTDGVKVRTNWMNDDDALWAHLLVDSETNQTYVNFVRGRDDKVMCSMFLQTGYAGILTPNCLQ